MPRQYDIRPTREPGNDAAAPPKGTDRYGRVTVDANERPELPEYPGGKIVAALLILYVVVVLGVDTLAAKNVTWIIAWGEWFRWTPATLAGLLGGVLPRSLVELLLSPRVNQIDLFKLIMWFIVPVLLSWRWMDWGAWAWGRWRAMDWGLLLLAAVGGTVAVFLIPYIPGVRELYQSAPNLTVEQKLVIFFSYNLWCLSWLPGWEFLHRYVLLAALGKFFPRGGWGWLVVPLLIATSEAAYHLVKPWPEMLAMFGFGFVASVWSYQRSNWLLPLLAHWLIELALVIFLLAA